MFKKSIANIKKLVPTLFILPVLIFITLPLFHDGLFRSMDDIQVVRIEDMYKELRSRQLPVRIAMDLANGASYMLFNFYSPFVYYLGALFHVLNFTLVISTKLVFLSGFLIAFLGIYLLLRNRFDTISAIFGSIIFLASPYLGYDAYHRGALAEFFAFCLLPFIFFSLIKLNQDRKLIFLILNSSSIALLIITHNLTAFITLPFIIVLILILFKGYYRLGFSSLILAILLASFYWIPAVFEKQFIALDQVDFITKTYNNHFLNPLQITGFQKISWEFLPPTLGGGIFLGSILAAIILILQKLNFLSNKKSDQFITFCVFSFFVSLFLASNFSQAIWKVLSPPLNYIQFPWRFLTLATFFGVISCTFLISKTKPKTDQLLLIAILIIPLFTISFPYLRPLGYNFIAKYTADDPCGTAGWSNEYIPIWVKECLPKGLNLSLVDASGSAQIKSINIQRNYRTFSFEYEATQAANLLITKYYFPGWEAKIDGQKVNIQPNYPHGLITLTGPIGNHNVILNFNNTPIRTVSNLLTLVGLIISGILAFKSIKELIKTHRPT